MTDQSASGHLRWCDKPFPACCLHCYHYVSPEGACGHAQRELVTAFFADHPDASCPLFGEIDVEVPGDDPVVAAIHAGEYRYEWPEDLQSR